MQQDRATKVADENALSLFRTLNYGPVDDTDEIFEQKMYLREYVVSHLNLDSTAGFSISIIQGNENEITFKLQTEITNNYGTMIYDMICTIDRNGVLRQVA